jgi:hypothetical protein
MISDAPSSLQMSSVLSSHSHEWAECFPYLKSSNSSDEGPKKFLSTKSLLIAVQARNQNLFHRVVVMPLFSRKSIMPCSNKLIQI